MVQQGFFPQSDVVAKAPLPTVPYCGQCKLYRHCQSPKMPVAGKGRRKILLVGEAPGKFEDEQGRPFVGPSGQLLQEALLRLGVEMVSDCWLTNAAICHPKRDKLPSRAVEFCRPNLIRIVNELKPEVIVLFGARAVEGLLGWLWKEDVGPISRWVGWKIPCQRLNAWVVPTWHPAFVLRSEGDEHKGNSAALRLLFERHLEAALSLKGRPWEEAPDYRREVRVMLEPERAAEEIARFMQACLPVAFDFETDRLKPEHLDARVVCCSVSDGETTIAYPWHGEAVRATGELLASVVPKIGWSCKFEDRWCRRLFGLPVNGWAWDGMLAAHVLDNRRGITGLKFQAFVRLGQESYDDVVKPYLKAEGGNTRNRIGEVGLTALLRYCGLDSLLEHRIGCMQAEELEVKL
jgi:uracil-DNA glycosylase family 4